MIQKFDLTHNPLVLYHFDGNGRDSSGNGLHLPSNNEVYRQVWPGVLGLVSGSLQRPIHDPSLKILGDVTVQLLAVLRSVPSSAYSVSFTGLSGDASGDDENYAYAVAFISQSVVRWFSEGTAGADIVWNATNTTVQLPSLGVPFHLAATRIGNVITVMINRTIFGTASTTLTTPTDASSAVLKINSSGSGFPELFGVKITQALTEQQCGEEYNRTIGQHYGEFQPKVESIWVGAPTSSTAAVVVKLNGNYDAVRLAFDDGTNSPIYTSPVGTVDQIAKFTATGLTAGTDYVIDVQIDSQTIGNDWGMVRTLPSNLTNFVVTFGGDVSNESNHVVFQEIALQHTQQNAVGHIILGDGHYSNINSTNVALYRAAYDEMFTGDNLRVLFATIPLLAYAIDDHDSCGNNSNATFVGMPACCQAYRERVPHYPLAVSSTTGSLYHTFDVGNVRFIVTDQRSAATANSATDNSSKSMLGATQKAWFKNILSNSSGKLIVWVCSRMFGGVATAGADHWGGFTTERRELADHIKANCNGRVIVLSADAHALAIDDGTNHDFATGGGCPIPTFQAAPLDRTPDSTIYGGATYSEGWFNNNGQFGSMEITDNGATIDVDWIGFDSTGSQLVSYSFTVNV